MAHEVSYHRIEIEDPATRRGVELFYRAAGPADAPTLLLLHGFPTSSHMFRGLIPLLAQNYRVIAPDLPGFGFSAAPPSAEFGYTFDHLAQVIEAFTDRLALDRYAIYIFDYGAPVGLRLALARPERVTAIISQNGNAYEEGLSENWSPIQAYWREPTTENRASLRSFLAAGTTLFQYTHGVSDPERRVAPESYTLDQWGLDRAGNDEIQLDLFRDYASNVALYPRFHAYFRAHRPPTLAIWGRNDPFFVPAGAEAYRRDNPDAVVRFVDGGHFPLETHLTEIAGEIRRFLAAKLDKAQGPALFEAALPPAAAQASLDTLRGLFGFVPNLGTALATEPAVLDAYLAMLGGLGRTGLDAVAQQVAMVAASQVNEADYGIAVHATLAAKLGAPAALVADLRAGEPLNDPKLEAVRRVAAAIAGNRTRISDADVSALLAAGYGPGALVAIALCVAAKTLANAVAHLSRVEIDAGFRDAAAQAEAA